MSAKKAKQHENGDASGDEENDIDKEESVIMVDFEAFTISDPDIPSVSSLLAQTYPSSCINSSILAEKLVELNKVGCVLKQCDNQEESDSDDVENMNFSSEVFGVFSVIPLSSQFDSVKEIKKWIDECSKQDCDGIKKEFLKVMTSQSKIGWIISERAINLPHTCATPAYSSLKDEIKGAVENGNKLFEFEYFMMVSPLHRTAQPPKGATAAEQLEAEFYARAEEEYFSDVSTCQFTCKALQQKASGFSESEEVKLNLHYKFMIATVNQFDQFLTLLNEA